MSTRPQQKYDGTVFLRQDLASPGILVQLVNEDTPTMDLIESLLKDLGGDLNYRVPLAICWSLPGFDLDEVFDYIVEEVQTRNGVRLIESK